MTRLDEIERDACALGGPRRDDILALVAVARAAELVHQRHFTHMGSDDETMRLRAALAPLLESTAPRQTAVQENGK
jgi:hypothetical protein